MVCKSVKVDYNYSLEPYYSIEDPNVNPFELGNLGLVEVSGTIEKAWINTYYLRLLFGGDSLTFPNAEFDMRLQASIEMNTPVFYLYKCRFKKGSINIPANGVLEESYDFIAQSAGTSILT
jgi:hypothetical protein